MPHEERIGAIIAQEAHSRNNCGAQRRDALQQELEAMTYQVTQLTGQLEARHEALRAQEDARRGALRRIEEGFARVEALLTRPLSADAALGRVSAGLDRLRKDLRSASKPKERAPAQARIRTALRARPPCVPM